MSIICRLTGPADNGEPDGIGITFAALNFTAVGIDAWDDEGNYVGLTIDGNEIIQLRDALVALTTPQEFEPGKGQP